MFALRRARACAALLVFGATLLASPASIAREQRPEAVADLRYGVTLYEYFLKDYLAALSELQVARQRGGIQGHGHHPLVLEGAMNLAFGMDRSAGQIFQQALADSGSEQVRNSAWFYLARMRMRRGDWAGAAESLARVAGKVDPALAPEIEAMTVNLALRQGQLALAESAFENGNDSGPWQPYLYYNLGTAHLRQGQPVQGLRYLDRLAQMKLVSEEHWSVQEKALIAAGFGLLKGGEYDEARLRFAQVRQDSPLAEQALLGYGWSALEAGEYQQALGPWQILAGRSPLRPAVQEALLAVPYAFEKLGAQGSALREFEAAENLYTAQLRLLEQMKRELGSADLIAALDGRDQQGAGQPPDPALYGLLELLSGDRFTLLRRDLADLRSMDERLSLWRRDVAIYRVMLEQRRSRRQGLLEQLNDVDYPARLAKLRQERNRLAQALDRAASPAGLMAIADEDSRLLWSRIERAAARLERLEAAGENPGAERAQLERYRGLVSWQMSERYSDWHWQASKRLRQLDGALEQVGTSLLRLQRVVGAVPDIAPFEKRLALLQQRLDTQTVALANSTEKIESALQIMVADVLAQQQQRLRHYQSQARLARARLYDKARLEASR